MGLVLELTAVVRLIGMGLLRSFLISTSGMDRMLTFTVLVMEVIVPLTLALMLPLETVTLGLLRMLTFTVLVMEVIVPLTLALMLPPVTLAAT